MNTGAPAGPPGLSASAGLATEFSLVRAFVNPLSHIATREEREIDEGEFVPLQAIDVLGWQPLFVLELNVAYEQAQHVPDGPAGGRSLYPVQGGRFTGERMRGVVEPNGMDWVQIRPDGAFMIDVRLMLRTHDGARIAMSYVGLTCGDDEPMGRFLRREPYEFHEVYSRTTPRFETGDGRYDWLNRTIAVANGMRTTGAGPIYHVFAVD